MYIHEFTNTSTAVNILQHFCKYRNNRYRKLCMFIHLEDSTVYEQRDTSVPRNHRTDLFQHFFISMKKLLITEIEAAGVQLKSEPLITLMSLITHFLSHWSWNCWRNFQPQANETYLILRNNWSVYNPIPANFLNINYHPPKIVVATATHNFKRVKITHIFCNLKAKKTQ